MTKALRTGMGTTEPILDGKRKVSNVKEANQGSQRQHLAGKARQEIPLHHNLVKDQPG